MLDGASKDAQNPSFTLFFFSFFLSSVILLTVITFQSSQAQNTTLRDCKEELSEDMEKADAMEGSAYQTLCEGKVIGKNDRKVPPTCEKGPGWQGVMTKTKNLEGAIDWPKLVHRPECVDRIILRRGRDVKIVEQPKRNYPINMQPLCDNNDNQVLVIIYNIDGPKWWSTINSEGCFWVKIDCDLGGQSQDVRFYPNLDTFGNGSGSDEFGSNEFRSDLSDLTEQGHKVVILASISAIAIS